MKNSLAKVCLKIPFPSDLAIFITAVVTMTHMNRISENVYCSTSTGKPLTDEY